MKPRVFSAEGFFTKDVCCVLPCLSIMAVRCENPHCGEVHGFQVHLQWLWWGTLLNFGPHETKENE